MISTQQSAIVVSTPIRARGLVFNHAEGIVVSTDVHARGLVLNHAEGLVAA